MTDIDRPIKDGVTSQPFTSERFLIRSEIVGSGRFQGPVNIPFIDLFIYQSVHLRLHCLACACAMQGLATSLQLHFSELQATHALVQPSSGFCTPMSREDLSYEPPLVQTLITSYYNVRDPPQLVQQRITQCFPIWDSVNGELQSVGDFSASSYDSALDAVLSDTHISGTPISRVGDISWYLHTANLTIHSRQRLIQNPKTLFGDGCPHEEYIHPPATSSTVRSVSSCSALV